RQGGEAVTGDLAAEAVYQRAFRSSHDPVLVAVPAIRRPRVLAAIRAVAPAAPIVVLGDDREPGTDLGDAVMLPRGAVLERLVEPELVRAIARARVAKIRRVLDPAPRVLILMQDDPDPDAIASALALRVVLGRTKAAAPIATFGRITRPENRAMTRLLETDVTRLRTTRADVDAFTFLHPLANHTALRRIERPDLPDAALDTLALGIARRELVGGVLFSHLGPVGYPELVAQFADLFLQVEGAEWSVVSGVVNDELHISVRNVGYVRGAGEVVR